MRFLQIPNCNLEEIPRVKPVAISAIQQALAFRFSTKQKVIVTVGDMHGNWWKLFCVLVYLGLVDAPDDVKFRLRMLYGEINAIKIRFIDGDTSPSPEEIKEFRNKYEEFKGCLSYLSLRINTHFCNQLQLVLIGDLFADRGCSDYCLALLLELAINNGIDIIIIMSNHDALFIRMLETNFEFRPWDDTGGREKAHYYSSCWEFYFAPDPTNDIPNPAPYSLSMHLRCEVCRTFTTKLIPRYRMALCYHSYDIIQRSYRTVLITHAPNNMGSVAVMLDHIGATNINDINLEYLMNLPSEPFYNHPIVKDFLGLNGHGLKNQPMTDKELSVFGHIGPEMLLRRLSLNPGQFCLDSIWGMPIEFFQGSGLQQVKRYAINGDLLVFIDLPASPTKAELNRLDKQEKNTIEAKAMGYVETRMRSRIHTEEAQERTSMEKLLVLHEDEDCYRKIIEASEEQERIIKKVAEVEEIARNLKFAFFSLSTLV